MQHQDKYNLKWHSYSDHLREALKEMMTSNVFADVTLVTDDKQKIRAVLVVQCSKTFYNLTVTLLIQFTSEEFSILKWNQ